MRVEVRRSFEKDIEFINNKKLAIELNLVIEELENCKALTDLRNVKKMKGKGSYHRIRIGNYRLGLKLEAQTITLLRFMHRKDIYNFFP